MAFFSVIIPTFNRRALLEAAVKSVLAQTFEDFELIVVDDGSSDGTWEMLESYKDRLLPLRQTNAGPGAARNLGAEHASGRYLVFHDSDDLLCPWALETFHHAISRHGEVSHLIGQSHVIESAETFEMDSLEHAAEIFQYSGDFLSANPEDRIWASCFAVVERECFKNVGGFDALLRCHEDQDLGLKLGCSEGFVRIQSPVTVCINQTRDSLSRGSLDLIYHGITAILHREKAGNYPGRESKARARRDYLTVNVRNQSLKLASAGVVIESWNLYLLAFWMNFRLGRVRYLFGFPVVALVGSIRGVTTQYRSNSQS